MTRKRAAWLVSIGVFILGILSSLSFGLLKAVSYTHLDVYKRQHYNREDYASIVEDVWTGRNTDAAMQCVTPEMMEENRKHIKTGNPSKLPGDKWGIAKITNIVPVSYTHLIQIRHRVSTNGVQLFMKVFPLLKAENQQILKCVLSISVNSTRIEIIYGRSHISKDKPTQI